jgi:hypothetical protein
MPFSKPPKTQEEYLVRRISDLEAQVRSLMNASSLTVPIYDYTNQPEDAVEGQVAIMENAPPVTGSVGAQGAWTHIYFAQASGDSMLAVASNTPTAVAWRHFEISDATVFSTSTATTGAPTNASGDTYLRCMKPGVYVFELLSYWEVNFTENAMVYPSIQTFHGPSGNNIASNAFPTSAPTTPNPFYRYTSVYPFSAADLSSGWASTQVFAWHANATSKNLKAAYLRVAYIPA